MYPESQYQDVRNFMDEVQSEVVRIESLSTQTLALRRRMSRQEKLPGWRAREVAIDIVLHSRDFTGWVFPPTHDPNTPNNKGLK